MQLPLSIIPVMAVSIANGCLEPGYHGDCVACNLPLMEKYNTVEEYLQKNGKKTPEYGLDERIPVAGDSGKVAMEEVRIASPTVFIRCEGLFALNFSEREFSRAMEIDPGMAFALLRLRLESGKGVMPITNLKSFSIESEMGLTREYLARVHVSGWKSVDSAQYLESLAFGANREVLKFEIRYATGSPVVILVSRVRYSGSENREPKFSFKGRIHLDPVIEGFGRVYASDDYYAPIYGVGRMEEVERWAPSKLIP